MNNLVYEAEFLCSAGNKNKFRVSSCMLSISVGQPSHESEKFLATIKAVNSFKECSIFIDDSLQRHTLAMGTDYSAENFYEKALFEGDRWLDRNKSIYSKLEIPYKIIRWDHWQNHSNYSSYHKLISDLLNNHSKYKAIFVETIHNYLARHIKKTSQENFDYRKGYELCMDYLKEECAALCLWIENGYNYHVYPFRRNEALEATYEMLIKPFYPELLIPVSLNFKARSDTLIPGLLDYAEKVSSMRNVVTN